MNRRTNRFFAKRSKFKVQGSKLEIPRRLATPVDAVEPFLGHFDVKLLRRPRTRSLVNILMLALACRGGVLSAFYVRFTGKFLREREAEGDDAEDGDGF